MELSHSQLLFPYTVHELVPTREQCPAEEFKEFSYLDGDEVSPQGARGRILHLDPVENSYLLVEDEQLVLKAFRLFHRIPSFGFVVEEKPRTGKLNVQKLKDLGNYFDLFFLFLIFWMPKCMCSSWVATPIFSKCNKIGFTGSWNLFMTTFLGVLANWSCWSRCNPF